MTLTPLAKERLKYRPRIPLLLRSISELGCQELPQKAIKSEVGVLFPHLAKKKPLQVIPASRQQSAPLKVGVVLSGGQAPGGHNVIAGLFDALKKIDPNSLLIGFLEGPSGIVEGKFKEISETLLASYRNMGGFDLIGSGRTKIETAEQLASALQTVQRASLDGLVIVGGDDSNTNAALLAEYFAEKKCRTCVVGVPKTIDGDLKSDQIEISFGFDTACKTYSELIGNISRDALSAKKYYHFIKLMGRSASHVTLECALQTHPNLALIGEEIAAQKKTLQAVVEEIADLICTRAEKGKHYGVILIPEGMIEFIPDIKELLTDETLLRDPHGNIQVSQIATEELLIDRVKQELQKRKKYQDKFAPLSHFFGYEGRSAFPTNFDATYCYALGLTAALLIKAKASGYMSIVTHLTHPVEEWIPHGLPLLSLMSMEMRKGKEKPVIAKALVDLKSAPFSYFSSHREKWKVEDHYAYPGPIQWEGADALCFAPPLTLTL